MSENFCLDQLIMTGFDYKNSPLEIREKVAFTFQNIGNAYKKLKQDGKVIEVVIVSTCNRSEIFAIANDPQEGKKYLESFYSEFFDINKDEINKYIIIREQTEVIRHIFEVACGFQSMVLGEDQILGQIKDSYEVALNHNSTGKILNRLFIESITSAKKIKSVTGISENALSVSSIGVKLIEQELTGIVGKKALVIGLGEMSRIAVQNMLEKQIGKIYVTNRTRRKVEDFAREFPGISEIDFKNRYEIMGDVDIIISCTAAPHYVVVKDKFLEHYKNQFLCMLDLAIPRDIEPEIQEIDNVNLYRLDDLEKIAKENTEKRFKAKEKGLKILEHDIRKYIKWINEFKIIGTIKTIQEYSKSVIKKEMLTLRKKLGDIDENQISAIENTLKSLAKSFAHQQMVSLKELIGENPELQEAFKKISDEEDL